MFKKFTYLMLFSGVINASQDYNLHITKSSTVVNSKEVFCFCGKAPECIMFFSGRPEYYCPGHIPEIEHVRKIGIEEVQQFLDSLNQPVRNWNHSDIDDISSMNMNGAHQGVTNAK